MPGISQPGIVGQREEISDLIFMYDAEETPYYSMIKKGDPPQAPIAQWPADDKGHVGARGVADRTPAPAATDQSKKYKLLESNNHMVPVTVGVGKKAARLTNRAGVGIGDSEQGGKLLAREIAKGTKALKTTIDRILSDGTDQREEAEGNGSETRGILSWISDSAQATRPVPENYRAETDAIYTGAFADLEEEDMEDIVEAIYSASGKQTRLMGYVGIKLKRKIGTWQTYVPDKAGYGTVKQYNRDIKDRALCAVVDLIEADGGTIELHLSRNINWDRDFGPDTAQTTVSKRSGFFLADGAAELRSAWDPEAERLANDGGGKNFLIDTCFMHCVTPKLCGKVVPSS